MPPSGRQRSSRPKHKSRTHRVILAGVVKPRVVKCKAGMAVRKSDFAAHRMRQVLPGMDCREHDRVQHPVVSIDGIRSGAAAAAMKHLAGRRIVRSQRPHQRPAPFDAPQPCAGDVRGAEELREGQHCRAHDPR